jgi:hypothetical protein
MKYLLFFPVLIYYIVKDFATIIQHQEFYRGIALFVLTAFVGIFFSAWLDIAKTQSRIRKKIGKDTYDWLVSEEPSKLEKQ